MSTSDQTMAASDVHSTRTSTLRPRNARLISYLDHEAAEDDHRANALSTSNSTSRGASPSSRARPTSRPRTGYGQQQEQHQKSTRNNSTNQDEDRGRGTQGLWDGWTQVQGLASSFFTNDLGVERRKSGGKIKTPAWMKQDRAFSISTSQPEWGPTSTTATRVSIGQGVDTMEERRAEVQARKREALLLSTMHERSDVNGRVKRKGSNASMSAKSPTIDVNEDCLVYRHQVQPHDTMAGVQIKYSCQAEAFRKVNRFWPNDNIQTRTQVVLPVDACSIRGRKVEKPDSVDLLNEGMSDISLQSPNPAPGSGTSSSPFPEFTAAGDDEVEGNGGHRHDSWVMLPGFSRPVEILRVSRREVGYFPPSRRKSTHHLRTPGGALSPDSASTHASPRTSFDKLKHSPTHAAQQAQLQQRKQGQQNQHSRSMSATTNVNSPTRQRGDTSRTRSSSTFSSSKATRTNSTNHWALRGPGGVGDLRGIRTQFSQPGPASDELNRRFAKYLPDMQPPDVPSDDDLLAPPGARMFRAFSGGLGARSPRASTDSLRSNRSVRSNSSNLAEMMKGLGRTVTNSMSAAAGGKPSLSRTASDRTLIGSAGIAAGEIAGGETGLEDLIELEDSDMHGMGSARGRLRSGGARNGLPRVKLDPAEQHPHRDKNKGESDSGGGGGGGGGSITKGEEELLNERFPVRGRITRAYGDS